jgi:MFS family permease
VASSLIGDLYPAGKRSRAMSVFMVGLPVGLALSFIVSSVIAKRWGWEMAFFVAGAPGLLLATVALFIHEPPRRDPNVISTPDSFRTSARAILILPTMWLIILSGALHNFNMYALGTFISSFLQRYHSLRIDEAGWVSGLVYGVGAVGIFAAGWLSDRAFRRGVRWRLHVAWGAILLSIPLLLAALHVPADHPWLCAAWLLPSMLLLYFYYGTVYASIQDVIPAPLRGLAMALYFCGMYVLGAVWGPAGFGWLSDLCARRAAAQDGEEMVTAWHKAVGLHDAFYIVPLLSVALVLVLMAAAITIKRDHARTLAASRS